MILDKSLLLADAQAVTTTAASTNYIDTLAEGQAIEPGSFMYVAVQTSFAMPGTNGTLTVQLQTADTSTFQDGTTIASSAAIPEATLAAGYVIMKQKLPISLKRYIRIYYVSTKTATAGKIDAGIVQNVAHLITDDDND